MPLGLLLARIRILRVGVEPYIMLLYATPMVALIPFILSMMGFGFAPKLLVVFLFAVFPVLYNTVEGARSIKPELIEVAKSFRSSEWALWREVMLPYTLPYTMTGVRQAIGRALVGMIAAEFFLSATGLGQLIMSASQNFDTGGVFRVDPDHRAARCRSDAARLDYRAAFRTLETVAWPSKPSIRPSGPRQKTQTASGALSGAFMPRVITGFAILLTWELVVRAFAPAYVAKPTTVILAIPKVITEPAFLQALGSSLAAVAEGLAITIVIGTVLGLLMGRSTTFDRIFRVHINFFNAMPMIVVLPLFSLWFGYSSAARIATIIFRRHLRHHHECRGRSSFGAARVSGSFPFIQIRTAADADRYRPAGLDALSARGFPACRRPRADRRGRR